MSTDSQADSRPSSLPASLVGSHAFNGSNATAADAGSHSTAECVLSLLSG